MFFQIKLNLSLKNEYRTAVMLVLLINVLLLIINIIDIDWIWFGFEYDGKVNLTQFVHEGKVTGKQRRKLFCQLVLSTIGVV